MIFIIFISLHFDQMIILFLLIFNLGPLVSYNKAVMTNIGVLFDKARLCQRNLSFHDIVLSIFFPIIQSTHPHFKQMFSFYCDSAKIQHIIYSQSPQKSNGVTVLIYPKVFTEPNNMQQSTR